MQMITTIVQQSEFSRKAELLQNFYEGQGIALGMRPHTV